VFYGPVHRITDIATAVFETNGCRYNGNAVENNNNAGFRQERRHWQDRRRYRQQSALVVNLTSDRSLCFYLVRATTFNLTGLGKLQAMCDTRISLMIRYN